MQIKIAAGEPLGSPRPTSFPAATPSSSGSSPRSRQRFRPQAGQVGAYLAPAARASALTSHLYRLRDPCYYDSLLGKLCVWAPNRSRPSPEATPRCARCSSMASLRHRVASRHPRQPGLHRRQGNDEPARPSRPAPRSSPRQPLSRPATRSRPVTEPAATRAHPDDGQAILDHAPDYKNCCRIAGRSARRPDRRVRRGGQGGSWA